MKTRLDVEMTRRNLTESRRRAQELVASGKVSVNAVVRTKSSYLVDETDEIEITGEQLKFVGRGGLKLEHAINTFQINVTDKLCLDIGASTGGFTDCLLQGGAKKVCAVDVGHGQLHQSLLNREDVLSLEGINIRDLQVEDIGFLPEFICCDVSFISLTAVIEKLPSLMPENCECALLIKPQFEVGRQNIGKNGIVKDKKAHIAAISKILDCCRDNGIRVIDVCKSCITGTDGNVEYLLYAKREDATQNMIDIKAVVG